MSPLPLLGAAVLAVTVLAVPQSRTPYRPAEDMPIALPAGDGAELTEGRCAACHSLDYVVTQPRGKGAKFWQDTVAKMRSVYGAELSDEEAARISAYLTRTYGER